MKRFAIPSATAVALCSFVIGGASVRAQDTPPPVEAPAPAPDAVSVVTLPVFGSPLVADVTTDAGGGLVDVTLTPADGYDPTKVRSNKVTFVNEEQGVTVKVSTKRGGERVEARAGTLEEVSGPGTWSGDVFDSGETTTVNFTIGAGSEGGPDITGIEVASPLEHTIGEVRRDADGERQSAKVTIEFTRSGQTRHLTISARLHVGDDGETRSAVKVSLSRVRGRQLADGPAVGAHMWSGQLCDGTAASVSYTVTDSGEITDVVATPEADVRAGGHRAWIAFSRHEWVSIKVRGEGEEMTVGASEKIHCGRNQPTVNGEQVELPDDHDWGGWRDGDDWGDADGRRDHDGDREGGDGDGGWPGGDGGWDGGWGGGDNDGDRDGDGGGRRGDGDGGGWRGGDD
jgi:hypothetical protein